MTEKEKQELEARRKEAAIKNMYYTRYFSVRYATAFFFFANLYWMLMLYLSNASFVLLLPLLLTVIADFVKEVALHPDQYVNENFGIVRE